MKNQSFLRDAGQFSGEGLTDDACKKYLFFQRADGSMCTTAVHVFSDSVLRTGPGAGYEKSARDMWKKAEHAMKSNSCKNRNHIAGQSADSEWHVFPCDASVQILPRVCSMRSRIGRVLGCKLNYMSSSSERSGYIRSKIQTWLLVFLWSRFRKHLEIYRRQTISPIC